MDGMHLFNTTYYCTWLFVNYHWICIIPLDGMHLFNTTYYCTWLFVNYHWICIIPLDICICLIQLTTARDFLWTTIGFVSFRWMECICLIQLTTGPDFLWTTIGFVSFRWRDIALHSVKLLKCLPGLVAWLDVCLTGIQEVAGSILWFGNILS